MQGVCGWSHLHPLGPCSPALPASSCGHVDLRLPQLSVVPSCDLTALSAVPQLAVSLTPLSGNPTISSFPLSHLPPTPTSPSFHYPRIPDSPCLFPVFHLSALPARPWSFRSHLPSHPFQSICYLLLQELPHRLLEPSLVLSCELLASCLFHAASLNKAFVCLLSSRHPPSLLPGVDPGST